MEIDHQHEPNLQGTTEKANLTFTNTVGLGQNMLFPSLLLSDPNPSQNIYQNSFGNQQDKQNGPGLKKALNDKIAKEANENYKRKYSEQRVLKSFYIYYALKVNIFNNFLIPNSLFIE